MRRLKGESEIDAHVLKVILQKLVEQKKKTSWLYMQLGLNSNAWFRIMHGERHISIKELLEIARILGVTPNDLLPFDFKQPAPPTIYEEMVKKIGEILEGKK